MTRVKKVREEKKRGREVRYAEGIQGGRAKESDRM